MYYYVLLLLLDRQRKRPLSASPEVAEAASLLAIFYLRLK